MSGELGDLSGALGDAVTGAALGTAAEPVASGVNKVSHEASLADDAQSCLNCGTQLLGTHCHSCGQKGDIHRTLSAIGHDLLHGVLHLDGKMWRTLPLLAAKPGQLTRRYIDGQRARFVSPMALFLFSVFAMFAVFQIAGISPPATIEGPDTLTPQLQNVRTQAAADIKKAQTELAAMAADDPARPQAQARLDELKEVEAGLGQVSKTFSGNGGGNVTFNGTGIDKLDSGLVKKWRENPGLMLYKLQNNSYKFSWLLIPLSIPFVWLLFFWKRQFRAYDHAVFVTYSLSFMSLLFLALSVAGLAGAPVPLLLALGFLIPPVHMYKQLKYGYDLTRLGAGWRTLVLTNLIVFIVLTLFVWLLLLIGAV